jgi:hypothetical protein
MMWSAARALIPGLATAPGRILTMTTTAEGGASEDALPTECKRCGNPLLLRRPERALCAQCEPHVPESRSYLASLLPA